MAEAMNQLNLGIRYLGVGRLKNTEMYGNSPIVVDSIKWGGESRSATLQVAVADPSTFSYFLEREEEVEIKHRFSKPLVLDRDTFWLGYNLNHLDQNVRTIIQIGVKPDEYLKDLEISNVDDFSSVLALQISDPVAKKTADILNTLVSVYNQAAIDDKNLVAKKTLTFIDERLRLLTRELSSVEGGLENYKERNSIPTESAGTIDIILKEISAYDNAITQQQIKMELLATVEEMLERSVDQFEFIPANLVLEDAMGLNTQIAQYNQALSDRERLMRSAAIDNPQLIELNQQLVKLRSNIIQSIGLYKRSVRLTSEETKQKIAQLQQRINQVPRQERELLEIKRQQNIKEALYLYLLQKKEETALSAAIVVPNARVIDVAVPSKNPISPVSKQIYAICLLLGFALPVGLIFLREMLDTNIYSESDIQRLTDTPVVGLITQDKSKRHIAVAENSRTAISERFRLLRTNLAYLSRGKKQQTILFTSGQGEEGKTFTAVNLAISLALNGHQVVVIGMDLRKPKTSAYLTDRPDHARDGVANYLIGDLPPKQIVYPSEVNDNLYYIPSGPIPPNPAELLSIGPRLDQLFEYLRSRFDYILIDTAPVGLVTDALLLQPYTDVSLFVVRYGKTPRESLKNLEHLRRDGKLINPAIVLNGVKPGKGYGYYGNTYGNGYYQDNQKNGWLPKLKSKV
jgi:capsular exopolysaccharide synthesis family protein